MKRLLVILVSLSAVCSAFANVTVALDAGRLRISSTTPMPVGSLLLLIAAGGDSTFSNTLAPGQYVAGNDIVIQAAAFNNGGGVDETNSQFSFNTTLLALAVGDQIALRWFPQTTYTQYLSNVNTPMTTAGQRYGTYSPVGGIATADGGSNWLIPSDGVTINLNFFTSDSGGGAELPAQGYANFTVVPEPSTFTALGMLLVLGIFGYRYLPKKA